MIDVRVPTAPPVLNDRAARALLELLTRAQARRAETTETPRRDTGP